MMKWMGENAEHMVQIRNFKMSMVGTISGTKMKVLNIDQNAKRESL